MHELPIGIFDSGFGGLSIFQAVITELPWESIVYFGDNANCPYGGKTFTEIKKLTLKGLTKLLKYNVKLIVVACNTATVAGMDYYRQKIKIPIVGVVPVVKTAVEQTKSNKIAVLSTPATARSLYLKRLIKKFAGDKLVFNLAIDNLVWRIEKGEIDSPAISKILRQSLESLPRKKVDIIALGCTHFPFLRHVIEKIVGPKIKILDSGDAVARQVRRILTQNQALNLRPKPTYYFLTSGDKVKFKQIAEKLLRQKIVRVDKI